jgi:hypothetical protein
LKRGEFAPRGFIEIAGSCDIARDRKNENLTTD